MTGLGADIERRALVVLGGLDIEYGVPVSSMAAPPASLQHERHDIGLIQQPQFALGPVLLGVRVIEYGPDT